VAGGATHILVLRSRRAGETVTAPGRLSGELTGRALRRVSPALETAFRTRVEREASDEALLAHHDADPAMQPGILSIRPAADSPVPSRLERDLGVIRAGLEAGRAAAHAALGGS
jgi:hypothetical protein